MDEKYKQIKKFWDDRAKQYGEDWRATLGEKYLRLLEIRTMIRFIKHYKPKNVLDVGCGNGYSTKIYARKFPYAQFNGMDYSEEMISVAKKNQPLNCNFWVGDVLRLDSYPDAEFDLITTQRCLQNLVDYKTQHIAISNLLTKKSPHGIVLLIECSKDGVQQLNRLRMRLGMKPIENIEPWHNNFFIDQRLRDDFGARIIHFTSTYMFISKVIHPTFDRLGYVLPQTGKFGYDKLYIIE